MLSLVKDGPVLPLEITGALEEERLVFFCGAGISAPTGLPNFLGLVDWIYEQLGEQKTPPEEVAYKQQQYDKVLALLEQRTRYPLLRKGVIKRLSEPSSSSLDLHSALLALAKLTNGGYRLVTTNFDNRFEETGILPESCIDAAPKLPVPKPTWSTLVHLHGRISEKLDPDGAALVLTTADFGTAYLTERWASRFITELAREFTILFIGYSVGDPVVAYMIDALAAENRRGRAFRRAFALAPYGRGREARNPAEAAWLAKGIVPILYRQDPGHSKFTQTIIRWAGLHAGGLSSRTQFALESADIEPIGIEDEAARRLLWALWESSGSVARKFANTEKPASIKWLDVFDQFVLNDSGRRHFEAKFLELFTLPTRVGLQEREYAVPLVDHSSSNSPPPLHPITQALGWWLMNHLDDPHLLNWVLKHGGVLHPVVRDLIREALKKKWQS